MAGDREVDRAGPADVLQFEGFRFDRAGGCLTKFGGPGIPEPIALGSRALDVLALLIERQGQLVTKDEIMAAVWLGTAVEEGNLTVQISALRRVLDRDRQKGSCIQTVPGRGYRFVAPVTRGADLTASPISEAGNGSGVPIAADSQLEPRSPSCRADARSAAPAARKSPRLWRAVIAAVASGLCLVIAVVAAVNWRWFSPRENASAPRLSIVVLPFTNLSNDPDQQYFADGINEDLTTNLSRIAHSFVISRNTAFTYRNKPVDTKQIARELGVRYVLAGSVQRSGNQVRVNAQLIDAETDAHLWAEQFDRDIGDLFALQNEITRLIGSTLKLELIRAEEIRRTEHPDALDYILRGRAVWFLNTPTRDSFAKAISLFEHALALDPKSAEAQADLAGAVVSRVLTGLSASAAADLSRAEGLVDQALPASPRSEYAHFVKGELLRAQHRSEDAIPEYEMARAINRNFPLALHGLALCKLYTGSIEEVIPLEEQAIRLSPRDPGIAYRYGVIGIVHLLQSRTDEAIVWLEKARSTMSSVPFNHIRLASAYALRGEPERAAAELAEARRLSGDERYSSIARLKARELWRSLSTKTRALVEAHFIRRTA
jgi:TolB-like protein/DNA-binding winged helix-turn-helix (wHTH) protein